MKLSLMISPKITDSLQELSVARTILESGELLETITVVAKP
jgi:hypothetical protein